MNHAQDASPEAPIPEDDFPSCVFGYGTELYHCFMKALIDGLREYEMNKEQEYGSSPLPAA